MSLYEEPTGLRAALREIRRLADTAAQAQPRIAAEPGRLPAFEWDLEQRIIAVLRSHCPGVPVIAEESFTATGEAGGEGDLRFVLDPIDGSESYASGSPLYAVSLALCEHDEPRFGWVYQPSQGTLFTARKAQGAYVNGHRLGRAAVADTLSVRSTAREDPDVVRFMDSAERLGFTVEDRMWCSSLKICWVASGLRAGVVKTLRRRNGHRTWWGTAAGLLVALEAGAQALTLAGERWAGQDGNLLIAGSDLARGLRESR